MISGGCLQADEGFRHGFEEEVLAPHDGLVDAQVFVEVVDAVLEDAFPLGVVPGDVAVAAEGVEDIEGGVSVAFGGVLVVDEGGQVPES